MCGGCGLAATLYMRSASPYEQALLRAQNHKGVIKALGAPVEADFFPSGNMRVNGSDGVAQLEIGLSGSKQRGTLQVKGVQTSGVWGFSTLKVVARDGTVVNLVNR
jgi:hypothetical protein